MTVFNMDCACGRDHCDKKMRIFSKDDMSKKNQDKVEVLISDKDGIFGVDCGFVVTRGELIKALDLEIK